MKRPPFKLKPEHPLPLILVAVVLSLTFIVSLRSKLRQPPAPAVASAPRTASDVAAKDYSWVQNTEQDDILNARREAKELLRDKIRLFFAVFGPLIIMASVSWGISFDVRNLKFAVYDRDQTAASRELVEYFDGSRYFLQQPPIRSEAEIDTVLKSSGAILVIDIPSGFGRDLARGLKPEVGFYVDGSMPFNATNIRGYIGSLITAYTKDRIAESGLPVSLKAPAGIEPRFMYNQDFDSINAIAPGFIETAMTEALPDSVREEWKKKIPLRRGGTPDDVADVAVFLASNLSSYVSGQVIQVDGGMNM